MATELDDFEQNMQREIKAFLEPTAKNPQSGRPTSQARPDPSTPKPKRTSSPSGSIKTGHVVKLAVRNKPLEWDTVFEHHSTSISKLEAQLQAEQAARKAGFRIIGHVVDIQPL